MRKINEAKGIIQDRHYEQIDGRTIIVYVISVEVDDGPELEEGLECRIMTDVVSTGLDYKLLRT